MGFETFVLRPDSKNGSEAASGWYRVPTSGKAPSSRVGHTLVWDGKGVIYCIGGATPDGAFAEIHALDISSLQWTKHSSEMFHKRYEHACYFANVDNVGKFYIFGGANEEGNLNSIQSYTIHSGEWASIEQFGKAPSPRTHHCSMVLQDETMVVFGGGFEGSNPVEDPYVYTFNVATNSWDVITTSGEPPTKRHGHIMAMAGKKMYIHGGMDGFKFYADCYVIDLEERKWTLLSTVGKVPTARAAHGGLICDSKLYIFGGLNSDGVLNDLSALNLVTLTWTSIVVDISIPGRLDFAMCFLEFCPSNGKERSNEEESNCVSATSRDHGRDNFKKESKIKCMAIHGGMDTGGRIFDDLFVCQLH